MFATSPSCSCDVPGTPTWLVVWKGLSSCQHSIVEVLLRAPREVRLRVVGLEKARATESRGAARDSNGNCEKAADTKTAEKSIVSYGEHRVDALLRLSPGE